ncbi:MAG: bifunctional DNA-formamidopyrimidine glycosylase/DNA-(apurinic or apyrimidinic site) lyase [Gemmatimonadales bacterium]|nr:bifunctional DNA-formamidopyrimidine glycosylase/DNA-(apurinic or apyrimidinic site) lyase [Gemmatimonadales bacterium]
MPELPEVENVARALSDTMVGRRLDGLKISYPGVLVQSPRTIRSALIGKTLAGVHRHGKYLILEFIDDSGSAHLMIHLRMTGQIFILDGYIPDKHVHLTFNFEGCPVHYRDIRKFGRLELVDDAVNPSAIAHVGPDMLEIRLPEWRRRIAHRTAPIKAILLDQSIAAGLGNIYVDESLFLAGVHPLRRPRDLDPATLAEVLRRAKQVLRLAIKHGGTTFMNFTNFHGKPGNFKTKLCVYGRSGQSCNYCGTTLRKLRVAGRSSVFCPSCQPES